MNVLTSLVLVLATAVMALGLGVVMASVTPSTETPAGPAQDRPPVVVAGDDALEVGPRGSGHERAQPPAQSLDEAGAPSPPSLGRASATGPWTSPLYPQNQVTLWDRIRVSSQKDRRAFLLGTAIQVHARATATTPGPQSSLPQPHGAD
jgi:hypothetical protein